jgi:hypothetical protein
MDKEISTIRKILDDPMAQAITSKPELLHYLQYLLSRIDLLEKLLNIHDHTDNNQLHDEDMD